MGANKVKIKADNRAIIISIKVNKQDLIYFI